VIGAAVCRGMTFNLATGGTCTLTESSALADLS
jgi:hypothetical protein